MKSFKEKVYAVVAKVPKGKVASYGQIARLAGAPRAGRAVGQLMEKNADTKRIPCHRVVGSTGALVGYAFHGVSEKRRKLIDEGVSFLPAQAGRGIRVNLKISGWKK
ncbi:MGMT family protein [Candidatus Kaiserbacteria bacterium]|nr:MGMT family protein [Candidatus Kaiserbacteria bacterium]